MSEIVEEKRKRGPEENKELLKSFFDEVRRKKNNLKVYNFHPIE
tara:strand:+ start:2681 stop:2812 length:132 start_codon:yes stop_codon:yes gene_type:complete